MRNYIDTLRYCLICDQSATGGKACLCVNFQVSQISLQHVAASTASAILRSHRDSISSLLLHRTPESPQPPAPPELGNMSITSCTWNVLTYSQGRGSAFRIASSSFLQLRQFVESLVLQIPDRVHFRHEALEEFCSGFGNSHFRRGRARMCRPEGKDNQFSVREG